MHLKPTAKIFFSLLCCLQIWIVSFAVVSPEVHDLCCDDLCHAVDHLDSAKTKEHPNEEHHHDHEPLEKHFCPVFIYSQGVATAEVSVHHDWEYVKFKFIEFTEPNSFSPVFCALLKKQRAPPLV